MLKNIVLFPRSRSSFFTSIPNDEARNKKSNSQESISQRPDLLDIDFDCPQGRDHFVQKVDPIGMGEKHILNGLV